MLSTTTVQILKSMSLTELKRLGDFVKSPYFNTSSAIEKIYEAVLKAHPDFNSESLHYEKMSGILFGSTEHSEKRIRNLYSEFGNLLRKFIGYEAIGSDSQELDVYIAKGLSLKMLWNISNKHISKSMKVNNDTELLLLEDNFRYWFWLDSNYLENLGSIGENYSPEYPQRAEDISEKLIIFFLGSFLKISLDHITYSKVFKTKENELLNSVRQSLDTNKILAFLEKTGHPYYSSLKVRYLLYYYSYNKISEQQYIELKSELLKGISRFTKTDKVYFIYRMFHLIHVQMVSIDQNYLNDVLELTDLMRELKIYPDEAFEVYPDTMFRDVFVTAIMLEKFDWAKSFADEFMNYLSNEVKENLSCYCAGHLAFFSLRYEEALIHFGKLKMTGFNEKLDSKFYCLMSYIELKAYESAISSVISLKQFCSDSREIPDIFRTMIELSLKHFNELIKCLAKGNKLDEHIYKSAASDNRFVQKNYVLKKMKQLI